MFYKYASHKDFCSSLIYKFGHLKTILEVLSIKKQTQFIKFQPKSIAIPPLHFIEKLKYWKLDFGLRSPDWRNNPNV